MKFTEYISKHQAFTTGALMAAMDSPVAAEQQLREAVRRGSVERVRRGLLVSNHGRFEGAGVDPYDVAAAADPGAVLSYHSALEAHGVAHNVGFECQFRSDTVRKSFKFRGIRYVPCGPVGDVRSALIRGKSSRRRAATREQTIVDCLCSPQRSGGAEEAVRGVSAFAYIDADALLGIVSAVGPSAAARVGWLLTEKAADWHVAPECLQALKDMVGSGPYRLGPACGGPTGFSAEWRLILPDANEEASSWITRS